MSLKVNETQQMTVTAYYSNQSTVDVTANCSHSFSVDGIASISSSGLLTANSSGTTVLTAAYQEKQDTANITVASSGGEGGGSTTNSTESINTQTPEGADPA